MTHQERIAKIEEECASPLGFAQRGVTSWDRDNLIYWRGKPELSYSEFVRLTEIENQVFGDMRGVDIDAIHYKWKNR